MARSTGREFRLAREARERFGLADLTLDPELGTARTIASRLAKGGRRVPAGELQAAGVLVRILGRLVDVHLARGGDPVAEAAAELRERLGSTPIDGVARAFAATFPRHLERPEAPDPTVALPQLLLLETLGENPAVAPFGDLVALDELTARAASTRTVSSDLAAFFDRLPSLEPGGPSLLTLLRAPALAEPDSLAAQLRWIRSAWGTRYADELGDLIGELILALDVLAEEAHGAELAWLGTQPDAGAGGPAEVLEFGADAGEPERYSPDTDWMPRLVLLAKSAYVWLDQLSRRYTREIRTLDAVPDEELDVVAARGITGLWLIGLWERSRASERIKRMRGQTDAVASAYSLDDYAIARDLGGPAALDDLRERAMARGIRLASDMVPNHMGIDSSWVIEHPERFLAVPEPPFPAYTFGGPDLSDDERVAIRIEDHYWESTDAAVVFQRVDRRTGETRYVYHGNDGTTFPWNDTAQLDYSQAAVREAVIGAILAVARRFPVIRFDAAMVLAKRHVQRLWFPPPGEGGAIPSRAGHGMTRVEFERAMPHEFWREVVDRVAAEVPDTLLLAEAFWLLEGYFVRTLGMHRVYNSAFMNMLRDERNLEYRAVIRNTLEFDPAILGRFVNFMSNPDEKTAVEQFGTGDKYFGVATMMATLPGLPMFGHGQFEGFAEQYGMEFRRAHRQEAVDEPLLAHHERTLVPLLRRRATFAGSAGFRLFDFELADGGVAEDVFAYANVGPGGDRSLILYHNRYAGVEGRARTSVAFAVKGPDGERRLERSTLGEALGLSGEPDRWVILRDAVSGTEFLRSSATLAVDGLRWTLGPYERRTFVDVREVHDREDHPWGRLAARLDGAGVPSLTEALADLALEPVHLEARSRLAAALASIRAEDVERTAPDEARPAPDGAGPAPDGASPAPAVAAVPAGPVAPAAGTARLVAAAAAALEGQPFDEWRLGGVVRAVFVETGLDGHDADRATALVRSLVLGGPDLRTLGPDAPARWFADEPLRAALRVNEADGTTWFEREAFELLVEVVGSLPASRSTDGSLLVRAAEAAGYRVDRLLAALAGPGPDAPARR